MNDHMMLRLRGYAVYAAGGFALVLNTGYSQIAIAGDGIAPGLAWFIAVLFAVVSLGVGSFLASPQLWGELWFSFLGTARKAGKHGDRSAPRAVVSVLLAIIVSVLLGTLAACYVGDVVSTWQHLNTMGSGFFVWLATIVLICGPEVSFYIAPQLLRQSKRAAVPALTEASAIDPQLAYLRASHRNRVQAAKQSAASEAGQHQHAR
jgi:hypothetical protein